MLKENGRNRSESRDGDRTRRRQTRSKLSRRLNREMLDKICCDLDKLCSQYQQKVSNLLREDGDHETFDSTRSTSSSNSQQCNYNHSCNCDKLCDPNRSIERCMNILDSKCKYRDPTVTRKAIQNIMSTSSTCQLLRLELSLQCPLSHAKMNLPVKSLHCQHIGCFDARTFLSVMMKKPYSLWKCPLCSVQANFNALVIDGFIQDILQDTPDDAKIIEFTSSLTWSVKKDTALVNHRKQSSKPMIDCIDLTYSPMQKKSTAVIDLTHSP